ncbi:MAG: glycosyltransferase [Candidatus Pacebacteria bacterium]|nr:glycosyltransferase [Candidatus Paceibacterota bacterium]
MVLSNHPTILIDACWWLGGNRKRGIGRYLKYYFQVVLKVPSKQRVWWFPRALTQVEKQQFVENFAGQLVWPGQVRAGQEKVCQQCKNSCIIPVKLQQVFFRVKKAFLLHFSYRSPALLAKDDLKMILKQFKVNHVLIASPFERPQSLLDQFAVLAAWQKQKRPGQTRRKISAIVFDLIPWQFPQKILALWPEEEQQNYHQRLANLRQIDQVLTISPSTTQVVKKALKIPTKKLKMLKFGLKTAWLEIPQEVKRSSQENSSKIQPGEKSLATTIAGGEWRKNLEGTLKYFARNLAKTHRLVVICQLSWWERLRSTWLAWRLGVLTQVKFAGQVSEVEKWQYLLRTKVFLFLSRAEGLGIPLLEAKKAGVKQFVLSEALVKAGLDELVRGRGVEVVVSEVWI